MRRIALFNMFPEWPLARQTPGGALRWGDAEFAINPADGRFDGCVVFDGLSDEASVECPPDSTFFIAGEPPPIKLYHPAFLAQFAAVVTCHSDTPHPRRLFTQQGYPWHIGVSRSGSHLAATLVFEDLARSDLPEKTKLISVIVSDKAVIAGHTYRRAFVARLREHFGARLDIFGRGIRDLPDKADGIVPYRYHVALENSQFPDYWTEKLADAFLGGAHPFYWGCPNLDRYFPASSFTPINIYDPAAAIATIEAAIAEDRFAATRGDAVTARDLVLNKYNLFALASELAAGPATAPATRLRLRPESFYRDSLTKKLRQRLRRAIPRRFRRRPPPI